MDLTYLAEPEAAPEGTATGITGTELEPPWGEAPEGRAGAVAGT